MRKVTLEHVLLIGSALVVALITVDAVAQIPLRELGAWECHHETGRDVCAWSWRRAGLVLGYGLLGWVGMILVSNAERLRNPQRYIDQPDPK